MTGSITPERSSELERGLRLEFVSLGYNILEAAAGLAAGISAGSVALLGFGLDSIIESSSAAVLVWRLRAERSGRQTSEDAERQAVRLVSLAFIALAIYVAAAAVVTLIRQTRPEESLAGVVVAAASLVVMPVLAARKHAAAKRLNSLSLEADSRQTVLCTYLSGVLLAGLLANALFGWWWADPIAALVIAGIAADEGRELWTTKDLH